MTPSFTSLRGWLKPDEAISAGRYQIATHLSGACNDTPVMSLRGWLKPDKAISAGRYQIATHLSDARKDTWSVIARSLATSSLPFLSLRVLQRKDEAIPAGGYQIATPGTHGAECSARKDKKGRPRNDINDVGGDKPRPYKLTY